MFSRSADRSHQEPRAAVPPQGVRDVSPPASTAPAVPEGVSVVARSDRLEGTLAVTETLRIAGSVQGTITATTVYVEEGAHVEADITADEAIIGGEYQGKLTCRQRLEVRSTGRVTGSVETFRLMLHEGGSIDGELHMLKQPGAPELETPRAAAPRSTGVSEAAVRVPVAAAAQSVDGGSGGSRATAAAAAAAPGSEPIG
jgi:cytoskeletal protein CcmA (bactofilin family)